MGVSLNGGTPKTCTPQNDQFLVAQKPMVVGETQHFRKPPKTLLGSIVGNLLLKPQIHHRFLQLFSLKFPAKKAAPEPEPVGRPWWASCQFDDLWWVRNGGFLKWWYPQIIHFNRVFHYKSSILGYPCFWKHPDEWEMVLHGTRFLLFFLLEKKQLNDVWWTWWSLNANVGGWNMWHVHVWRMEMFLGDNRFSFWVKHSSDFIFADVLIAPLETVEKPT